MTSWTSLLRFLKTEKTEQHHDAANFDHLALSTQQPTGKFKHISMVVTVLRTVWLSFVDCFALLNARKGVTENLCISVMLLLTLTL